MRGTAKQAATEFALVVQEALNVSGVAKVTLSAGDPMMSTASRSIGMKA